MGKMRIEVVNDGKGKSQSFEAKIVEDEDNFCYDVFNNIVEYGETEEEAIEELKNKVLHKLEEIKKLFE